MENISDDFAMTLAYILCGYRMGQIERREEKICPGEVIADGQTDGRTDEQTDRLITIGRPQIGTLIIANRFYNIIL